ncbi:hypothetical protein TVAG_371310 [Trichomonas vaginalis G3]|uniref:RRM domain-containing protein n=1 Tax=Trichomonas vaginalis (strain ATCC PRA-98 / G3) TaxID=412133 RepID=A2FYF3_TRIV3|nr:snRNA binding [Trichomonas vaginalis G3]EAX90070.1 hypothetical protein TVAG_371310 [Trichomonas vaginalis G3]KAI5515523.1 snRNA binding [Trichomonas vaginalis G3]|eukprot:XP_001303000.1 hypothetical protein [Trichomonas vaginalis G3]
MPPKFSEEIIQLFRARPKLKFLELPEKPQPQQLTGISSVLPFIKREDLPPLESEPLLPIDQKHLVRRKQKNEENNQKIAEMKQRYNPRANKACTGNANNTLFVSGLPKEVTEQEIVYEFNPFGRVKTVNLVRDPKTNEQRSYCFVEYETEAGFRNALNHKDKFFIKKPLLVDFERARTIPNWIPRRLGGGEGGLSRRFQLSKKAIQCQFVKRRKRAGWRSGKRYNSTIDFIRRRRKERYAQFDKTRGKGRISYSTYRPDNSR